MAERIELPPVLKGTAEEQAQQLRSYLYRIATVLNVNLDTAGSEAVTLTDEERILINNIARAGGETDDTYYPGGHNYAEAETLKSLIIKTAKFVKTVQDTYNLILFGEESAQSDFGTWNRKKGLRVDVTPDGIKQTFSYAEIISGLKDYEINSKNYIKSGLLRTEQGLPVYGVAVGKDVTTFSEDGTETYNDGNKCVELTADKLTFYIGQDPYQSKVAQFAGDELAFFQGNEQKVMSLLANALTFLSGGKKLTELKPGELAFYQGADQQGNEQKVASMKNDGLTFLSGGKKLSELKPAELAFYQGNEQKVASLKDDGLTFLSGGKKLSELKPAELAFFQGADQQGNEQKVVSLKNDGLTFMSGGKKLAEMKPAGIVMYQGEDSQGNEIKVMELTGGGLEFYYNGVLRSKMDQNGTSFYKGNDPTNDLLAKLSGTALQFYENGQLMAEFSAGNQQQQIAPTIYFHENVEIPSVINNPKGIKLQSGNSIVLIDPSKIHMSTDGLVSILGNDNSIIRLIGSDSDDKIFQADADGGVLAKNIKSSEAEFTDLEVSNLRVTGTISSPMPNFVISSTQPASGNNTIWLEPAGGGTEPYIYTENVNDSQTSDWTEVTTNVEWTQTCDLAADITAEGAKKLKISGKLYKNGSTAAWDGELTAVANVDDDEDVTEIDLGTIGTFPYMQSLKWDYGFTKEVTIDDTITTGKIVSITYTWTISRTTDAFAALSYPHDVSVTCSGGTGSGTSDVCTVHYIP